jgi:hypothetical protein
LRAISLVGGSPEYSEMFRHLLSKCCHFYRQPPPILSIPRDLVLSYLFSVRDSIASNCSLNVRVISSVITGLLLSNAGDAIRSASIFAFSMPVELSKRQFCLTYGAALRGD